MAGRWLLKTEPSEYSWQDLERGGRAVWDGVSNALALRNLREMAVGDPLLVYHTGDERAAIGIAKVARAAYPDPKVADPKRVVVDVAPVRALARPVTLAEMKSSPDLAGFALLRLGRLSVVPVSSDHWAAILKMATRKAG